jgi:exosortase/archaeosortase family protein
MSASVTAVLLNGFGIESLCKGTAIIGIDGMGPPIFKLEVEDPCSGIRSIVALFVGTAAYGAYLLKSVKSRWILFLSSFPIAFLGNVIRLFLTALVATWWGQQMGMRLHDNALFIIAPVYILCVFKLTDLLHKWESRKAQSTTTPATIEADASMEAHLPSQKHVMRYWQWGMFGIIATLLPCVWLWALKSPRPQLEADTFIVQQLGAIPGAECWRLSYCYNQDCMMVSRYRDGTPAPNKCDYCASTEVHAYSLAEHNILPKDTRILRAIYDFGPEGEYTVSVVVAGQSRTSIHRPELCLPSQGKVFESAIKEILPGVEMVCGELRSKENANFSAGGFAYVYLNAKGATVSDFERVVGDTFERAWHCRIPRWAMMTISSDNVNFKTPQGEALLKEKMALFYDMVRTDR